jgi:hypothetical protein
MVRHWVLPLIACLTLGLAPYWPRPHIVEKIFWLATGKGLRPIDIFDLILHASPWVWLASVLLGRASS